MEKNTRRIKLRALMGSDLQSTTKRDYGVRLTLSVKRVSRLLNSRHDSGVGQWAEGNFRCPQLALAHYRLT